MKQALQNPIVVGCLSVVAITFVIYTITKKDPTPVAPIPASVGTGAQTGSSAKEKSSEDAGKKIDATLAQWSVNKLGRDPFNPATKEEEHVQPAPAEVGKPVQKSEIRALTLGAIWHGDDRHFAVINGKVLGQGDRIMEYQIENILSDQVILLGTSGHRVIGFESQPQRAHSSSSNDGAAEVQAANSSANRAK